MQQQKQNSLTKDQSQSLSKLLEILQIQKQKLAQQPLQVPAKNHEQIIQDFIKEQLIDLSIKEKIGISTRLIQGYLECCDYFEVLNLIKPLDEYWKQKYKNTLILARDSQKELERMREIYKPKSNQDQQKSHYPSLYPEISDYKNTPFNQVQSPHKTNIPFKLGQQQILNPESQTQTNILDQKIPTPEINSNDLTPLVIDTENQENRESEQLPLKKRRSFDMSKDMRYYKSIDEAKKRAFF
ncbi:UNKNOWN [Stylonychia lemnae]|uniref:Uncharacterized protein n=1 Tax=Stylonychia lemnae TaxID=5949 RepID=A0A078AJJ5_STYLE|nr:UNKNOWN [Stylonychia lemnae]|eukprot:CDW82056.1 UNKNOWN [Stylonychia lemnae]